MSKMYDEMIRSLFREEDKNKYSHLIIAIDKEDMEFSKIYVSRSESIKDALFQVISRPNMEIHEIYNYDINLEEQISESRTYHIVAPYNKINDAYEYASVKHEGKVREDGTTYISHPVRVAKLVKKYYKDHPRINELVTSAYLHDTVEDTDATIEEIKDKFGEYVAYLVAGLTNDDELKHKMGKADYLSDKMMKMDDDILALKLCDRLDNVLDLKNASTEFRDKYIAETLMIINYLLSNREVSSVEREIIKEINIEINNLRKKKILKYRNNN